MTATQFAWTCLGSPTWPPPPKLVGFVADERCWLCGAPAGTAAEPAWSRRVFSDTFTNVNLAAVPTSQSVCQACAYLSTGDGWKHHAARFPALGVKTTHPLSWRSYSHLFVPGHHTCPNRAAVRDILLAPPQPPFLLVLTLSGQKHLLFRASVAYDRDRFPVQVEEDTLWLERDWFTQCLLVVESSLAAGLTRDEIISGRYRSPKRSALGAARDWRALTSALDGHRVHRPDLLALATHVACAERRAEIVSREEAG